MTNQSVEDMDISNVPFANDDSDIERLDWDKQNGLLPAIVQSVIDHRVLMLGYMSRESLSITIETGDVTFYSRSQQRLWKKGELSGNVLEVVSIGTDCDRDTLLIMATPRGPTCHLGTESCFETADSRFLGKLDDLICQRERQRPEKSYTTTLFRSGIKRIAQKLGEEAVETALAAVDSDDDAFLGESADLLYHYLVLLRARGYGLKDVERVLAARHLPGLA